MKPCAAVTRGKIERLKAAKRHIVRTLNEPFLVDVTGVIDLSLLNGVERGILGS
jgi:L-asparaginase II